MVDSIDMLLFCPKCHTKHVDEPDERTSGWVNPPHRSHLCHFCGTVWRPADVPTNGVDSVKTRGKADNWPPAYGVKPCGRCDAPPGTPHATSCPDGVQACAPDELEALSRAVDAMPGAIRPSEPWPRTGGVKGHDHG